MNLFITSYKGDQLKEAKKQFTKITDFLDDFVLLRTCERVEIYSKEKIDIQFKNQKNYIGEKGKKHLLLLATGAESKLFGEIEIFQQIKKTLKRAKEEKHLSKNLSILINEALKTAKKIRGKTNISTSWAEFVTKTTKKDRKIAILGEGLLAQKIYSILKRQRKDAFYLSKPNYKNLEDYTLIIIKNKLSKDEIKAINQCKKIINLSAKLDINTKYNMNYFLEKAQNIDVIDKMKLVKNEINGR